jgi:hypothetical protein
MNNIVKGYLSGMPKDFIIWLESLRNKNPLKGSDSGRNANSVFVEIGKNLVVDAILEARDEAINPRTPEVKEADGSEIMVGTVTK